MSDRNRYKRRDGEEIKEGASPMLKAVLLIVLILACYAIYKTYDARQEVADEPTEIKHKKGDGFFGEIEEIPVLQDFKFTCMTGDAVRIEYRIVYKLRANISQENIKDYNSGATKAMIREIVHRGTAEVTASHTYANDAHFIGKLKHSIGVMLNKSEIDLFQITKTYDANFVSYIKRRKEEQIKAELIKADVEREEAQADAQIQIMKARERADKAKEEAIKMRDMALAEREAYKKHITDSITLVYQIKMAKILSETKMPEMIRN